MIISDEHKYLFVEQRHTACSATRDELIANYGGRPILHKHATYAAFLRVATREQRRYFVFAGIRNPLDEAVSLYFKLRTDHQGKYSERFKRLSKRQREAFAYVSAEQPDFPDFLRRFYQRPYDNDTIVYHKHMDQIIRFEHLQEDFSLVLRRLGLEQVRPLPASNQTDRRGHYLDYYPPELQAHAARVFGPYMRKWGYELPTEWVGVTVPRSAMLTFRVISPFRYVYRRWVRIGTSDPIKRREVSRPGASE